MGTLSGHQIQFSAWTGCQISAISSFFIQNETNVREETNDCFIEDKSTLHTTQ